MKLRKIKSINIVFTIFLAMVFLGSIIFAVKTSANQTIFKLTNVSVEEKSDSVVTNIDNFDNDDINLNLEFHKVNDYVVYKLLVKNTSKHDYKLVTINDNNTSSYISYEYNKHENELIKAGNSFEVELKVIYKNEQTDVTKREQIENFKLLFSFVNEKGEPVSGNIDINPKTFDPVVFFYFLAVISFAGMIVTNFKFKCKKVKRFLVTLIVLIPISIKAADSSFDITIKSSAKLYDKLIVKYNLNGTEVTKIIKYGQKLTKPSNPTKDGYSFAGWYLNGELCDFSTPVKEDEELVPMFTPNPASYTVIHKYEKVDGSFDILNKSEIALTDEEVTAPILSKTGFNDPTEQKVTVKYDGSSSVTYEYLRKTFDLEFNTNGGTAINKASKKYEEEIGVIPETTKNHYVLDNWYTLNEGGDVVNQTDKVTANKTIYARWKKSVYFANIENTIVNIVKLGTSQINITNINEIGENIIFESGDDSIASVDENGLITAKAKGDTIITLKGEKSNNTKQVHVYVVNENVTVHFNSHDGTSVSDLVIESGSQIGNNIPAAPTKEHFIFDDWYTTDGYTTKVTPETVITQSTTFHAKWNKSVYHAEVANSSFNLTKNNTAQIVISNISEIGENISYSSSNDAIASVDENGLITAKAKGNATITISGSVTGETKTVTVYITNENVTVHFNSHGGTSVSDVVLEAGSQMGSNIPNGPTRSHYIFDDWYITDEYNTKVTAETVVNETTTFHAKWNKSVYFLDISNENITMFNQATSAINILNSSEIGEAYTFTSSSDATASVDENGVVTAHAVGTATITIKGQTSLEERTVNVTVNPVTYTVSFNTHNSVVINPINVEEGQTLSSIPTPSDSTKTFVGWFYNEDGTGAELTTSTVINESHEYHAKWVGIVCIKATTLNQEVCDDSLSSTLGCKAAGYTLNGSKGTNIVTYGNISSSDILQPGDAYLCDVNGTGYTKRFYYLRTLDNKAVFILNQSVIEGVKNNVAESYLPSTNDWNNLSVTFENDKAARFITRDDLQAAIGGNNPETPGALDEINFIYENTSYALTSGRSTVWVLNNGVLDSRYHKNDRNLVVITSGVSNSQNSVRPVIEVPLNQLDRSYVVKFDSNGGNPSDTYQRVSRGGTLGSLPQVSKTNYAFDGWYKSQSFTQMVNEDTVVDGYHTYYAKWLLNAESIQLNTDAFTLNPGVIDEIIITSQDEVEPLTYQSSDDAIASVDQDGVISAHAVGNVTITITGTLSHTTKNVTVNVIQNVIEYDVNFETFGGSAVSPIQVQMNSVISPMPEPTLANNTFKGWYTDTTWTTEFTDTTPVRGNITLYARWMPNDTICEMNKEYYNSLQTAVDTATTEKTTIYMLKDVSLDSGTMVDLWSINNDKNIIFDLGGHTLYGSNTYVIRSKANIEIVNGTIRSSAPKAGAVESNGGTLKIENLSIIATGDRQALYNDGGVVTIGSNVYLEAKPATDKARGTVHNASGNMQIIGGLIVCKNSSSALYVAAGNVTIGVKDGNAFTSNPIFMGETYGIKAASGKTVSFFDGTIKGKTDPLSSSSIIPESKIEDDYKFNTQPEVDDLGYKLLYLIPKFDKYVVTLNANGGQLSVSQVSVNQGDSITSIPEPTKGIYHFDGWYFDDQTFNDPVTLPYTPDANVTIYAKWSYTSSSEIINFNITNSAMNEYYSNISSWKNLSESSFLSTMNNNFNNYSCSACTGPRYQDCPTPAAGATLCDQPLGYNTGTNHQVNVYKSSITNKEKGALVTYTTSSNGIIYNMIPGEVYYWELDGDPNVYGYVKALGERRNISSSVRNVRDLGGMTASYTVNQVTKTGTLKYGILFRGSKLSTQSDATELSKLGITEELDLRAASDNVNPQVGTYKNYEIVNYVFDTKTATSKAEFREALTVAMQDVVAGKHIYFHCKIGTDRTGTLAYFLEGLLGVPYEQRIEDYELSYFYGLLNRTRFHDYLDGSSYNPRFTTMASTYDTNEKIYNWYINDPDNQASDILLVQQFRDAMINYNN